MTENKRFTITGDRGISDHQKKRIYDLNDFDGMISVTECLNELHDENKNLSKLNKILEGFLLDKGYDFNDIIKFIQDRTDGRGDVE